MAAHRAHWWMNSSHSICGSKFTKFRGKVCPYHKCFFVKLSRSSPDVVVKSVGSGSKTRPKFTKFCGNVSIGPFVVYTYIFVLSTARYFQMHRRLHVVIKPPENRQFWVLRFRGETLKFSTNVLKSG